MWRLGIAPPGDAELETTGRVTGLIAQHGHRSDYVGNIEADPAVRFRTGTHHPWSTGVPHILDGDDPYERRRLLRQGDGWRHLCLSASRAMSTDPLTIRIDLDFPSLVSG